MSNTITPNNPNIPSSSYQEGNISSLVSPSILDNLQKSKSPLAFGDQLNNQATALVIGAVASSPISKLLKEKENLIAEGIKLDVEHKSDTTDIENANYEVAKAKLEIKKKANNDAIENYFKDPFKKTKEKRNKVKNRSKELKKQIKKDRRNATKTRLKTALKSASKSLAPLVPILVSTLTNKIVEIVIQNGEIAKLVDRTNAIIEDANTSNDPIKLNNAKLYRDNTIRIIQSNEDKIKKIKDSLQTISIIINVFNIIVQIISAIPIPTAVPPGIGIPLNVITTLTKILDRASRIVAALSSVLEILVSTLNKVIEELEKQKARLLSINGTLEAAAATGINSSLTSNPNQFGTDFGTYKGFKFAIKEESGPRAISISGNKRHYAEAIDTNNVAVLKSELSFTLDPNDLIDQLKLIIDSQNLIA